MNYLLHFIVLSFFLTYTVSEDDYYHYHAVNVFLLTKMNMALSLILYHQVHGDDDAVDTFVSYEHCKMGCPAYTRAKNMIG